MLSSVQIIVEKFWQAKFYAGGSKSCCIESVKEYYDGMMFEEEEERLSLVQAEWCLKEEIKTSISIGIFAMLLKKN